MFISVVNGSRRSMDPKNLGTRIILEHTIRIIILEHNIRTTDKDHSGTQMIPTRIILEHKQSFGVYLSGVGGWGGVGQ